MSTIPLLSANEASLVFLGLVDKYSQAALRAIVDGRAKVVPVLTEAEERAAALEAFESRFHVPRNWRELDDFDDEHHAFVAGWLAART